MTLLITSVNSISSVPIADEDEEVPLKPPPENQVEDEEMKETVKSTEGAVIKKRGAVQAPKKEKKLKEKGERVETARSFRESESVQWMGRHEESVPSTSQMGPPLATSTIMSNPMLFGVVIPDKKNEKSDEKKAEKDQEEYDKLDEKEKKEYDELPETVDYRC